MFETITSLFRQQPLDSFDHNLTREALVQSGRILFVEDDEPLLIDELRKSGFAVDHDRSGNELNAIDNQIYDLAIVDYHGVGRRLGAGQGLDVVKHIKRVSPRTRVIAYTSRSLTAAESEFFRLSHAVLPKDLGLGDSLVLIEGELRKALSKEHLFEALLQKLNVLSRSEREKIRSTLITALNRRDETYFQQKLTKLFGLASEKAAKAILSKMFAAS